MTLPQVTITELDGALGVLPPSAGRLTAFIGVSTDGPYNVPATFGRVTDLSAAFGRGALVEAAAYYITNTGRPALVVRANAAVVGTAGAITHTGTGTSVVTVSPTVDEPADDLEIVIKVVTGGTVGTAGISFQISPDGGYNYLPPEQLGVLTEITTIAGIAFAVGVGTMVAGDLYYCRTTGPNYDSGALTAALAGLGSSSIQWEQVVLVGPLATTAMAGNVETWIAGLRTSGRYRSWIGTTRMPNEAESESAYLAAMNTLWGSFSTTYGSLCSGAARVVSGYNGRNYRRPFLFGFVGTQCNVSEEIDVADVNLGPLRGVAIVDRNGNPLEHDESLSPGLDDARFVTARTWDGYPGVYVTRPRIFSVPTSDFQIIPYRRVLNLAEAVLRDYFIRRLNRPIRVDTTTGYILEADAVEIEAGATQAMRSALLAKPKASGVQFVLSRIDNILSTKTLTGTARVLPLAYPEFVELSVGFNNPALQIAA